MNPAYKEHKQAQRQTVDAWFDYADYKIGEGTYGVVYKARKKIVDPHTTPIPYALKKIKATVQTEGLSTSACREISLLREIKHENVICAPEIFLNPLTRDVWLLFDYAEYDLYQIIEYYRDRKGQANAAAQQTQTPPQPVFLEEHMIKSLLWQSLNGIHYLHSNWILHRDLKPANILVMGAGKEHGRVKIGDLGMARLFQSPLRNLADVDPVVVTIWYRAPELLLGAKHYTKAIDMWAIGCIFGELITARPIFLGEQITTKQTKTPFQGDQLDKIFQVLGFPNEKDWPELSSLPDHPILMQNFLNKQLYDKCSIEHYFRGYMKMQRGPLSPAGLGLLSEMLTMDPNKRITAEAALRSNYFKESPTPSANAFEHLKFSFPPRSPIREDKDKNNRPKPKTEARPAAAPPNQQQLHTQRVAHSQPPLHAGLPNSANRPQVRGPGQPGSGVHPHPSAMGQQHQYHR